MTNAHLDVIKAPSAAFFGDDKGAVYALDARERGLVVEDPGRVAPACAHRGVATLYLNRLFVAVGSSEPESARDAGLSAAARFAAVSRRWTSRTAVCEWKSYLVSEEPHAR